jgi:hypothetical protein
MKLKSLVIGVTALTVAAATPATVFAGYTPANRATFECLSPTNCPGAEYVTFNSFTNAPNYGDERAFFDAKDASITGAGGYQDKMKVKNGQKIVMRVYIHNNANPAAIGEANATAKNTQLKVMLPSSKKNANVAAAQISADNASPKFVSDTVDLSADAPFSIAFDKSAPVNVTYRPNGQGEFVTRTAPNTSFSDDYTLNANFGDWKGCFEYAALVTFTAVVKMDEKPPVTPEQPKPQTPAAPQELPKTGAGDVVAAVAGATVLGAIAHRLFTSRRLSRR